MPGIAGEPGDLPAFRFLRLFGYIEVCQLVDDQRGGGMSVLRPTRRQHVLGGLTAQERGTLQSWHGTQSPPVMLGIVLITAYLNKLL